MEEKFEDSSDMRKSLLTTQGDYFASNCLQYFECIHYLVNDENKFRKGGKKSRTALSRAPYVFPKEPNTFPFPAHFTVFKRLFISGGPTLPGQRGDDFVSGDDRAPSQPTLLSVHNTFLLHHNQVSFGLPRK